MKSAKMPFSQLRRIVSCLGILAVAWLQLSPAVCAQDSASISGVAQDATGAAIEKATLHIKNPETGTERIVQADDAGRFHAPSLPVGTGPHSDHKSLYATAFLQPVE